MTRLLALLVLTTTITVTADEVPVWVGTNTPRNGPSKGIYHLTFNTDTGRLSKATLAAPVTLKRLFGLQRLLMWLCRLAMATAPSSDAPNSTCIASIPAVPHLATTLPSAA